MIESSSRIKNTRLPCFIKYNQNAVLLDHRDGQAPSLFRCHPYQLEKWMPNLVRCGMSIGIIDDKNTVLECRTIWIPQNYLRVILKKARINIRKIKIKFILNVFWNSTVLPNKFQVCLFQFSSVQFFSFISIVIFGGAFFATSQACLGNKITSFWEND